MLHACSFTCKCKDNGQCLHNLLYIERLVGINNYTKASSAVCFLVILVRGGGQYLNGGPLVL